MEKSVGSCMVKSPYVTDKETPLKETLEFLTECGIRHLPVVEDGRLIGVLSERDLREALALNQSSSLTVGDVMKADVYVALRSTPLQEIVRTMQDRKIGSTVIVNPAQEVVGIFTVTDALGLLADLLDDDDEERIYIDDYYDAWDWESLS